MITKPVLLTVASSLLFFSGCAAKNRWFSRKDYSEMQDPFMESEALADKGSENSEKASGDVTGRTRLSDSGSSVASAAEPTGAGRTATGRSLMQTSASDEGVARTGQVSTAAYPEKSSAAVGTSAETKSGARSYQGPALSDFLSKKQSEKVNSAAQTANEISSAAVGGPANARTMSPAARAAALPNLDDETAGFSNFLQEKSNTVNQKSEQAAGAISAKTQQAANTVRQSEESVEDFASWATQEQQRWSQKGSEAASNVAAMPEAAKQQTKSAMKQTRKMVDDAVMDFNTPQFDDETTAQPLMKRYAEPSFEEMQKPVGSEEGNPFDNPFESSEFEQVPVKKTATASTAPAKPATSTGKSRKTLDESFQMDSGWKPSHLEHP